MKYVKLEKFNDLVRLAATSILPVLFYVERQSDILCFSIAPLSLEDTILWYARFDEKPVPEYALFNAVDGTIVTDGGSSILTLIVMVSGSTSNAKGKGPGPITGDETITSMSVFTATSILSGRGLYPVTTGWAETGTAVTTNISNVVRAMVSKIRAVFFIIPPKFFLTN